MEQDIITLQQEVAQLKQIINSFVYPDKYKFERTVQHKGNKLGFYSKNPIVQPTAITSPSGGVTADINARLAIIDIIAKLQALGLTA